MKNFLIFCFLFISSFNVLLAQEKYENIQGKVKAMVAGYSKQDTNYKFLEKILTSFEKSGKPLLTDLTKNNVGIAMVLSDENTALTVYPARFTAKDYKMDISAIRSKETGGLSADMKEYVHKYLYKMEEVGSTRLFKALLTDRVSVQGTFSGNVNEYIVDEPYSISFVRSDKDWLYLVSIDNKYKSQSQPRVIVYAFKIKISGADIFNTGNSITEIEKRRLSRIENDKAEKEKFPLFHDVRTDDIRGLLAQLIQEEPFKSNQELLKNKDQINAVITRYNLKDFVPQFNYFLKLDFSMFGKKDEYDVNELLNIKHLSAHALADYYLSQDNYTEAINFYKKSVFEFPYEVSSGTNLIKDIERIIYDISKACYKAGRKDEAYGYLLGLIIDSQNNEALASKDLNAYLEKEKIDKQKFRSDVDQAMKTIRKGKDDYSRSFTFRNKEVFFYPLSASSSEEYQKDMKNSVFYNSLK